MKAVTRSFYESLVERAARTVASGHARAPAIRGSTGAPKRLGAPALPPYSGDRTRTCDPVVNSHLLYQLSYAGPDRAQGAEGPK